MKRKLFETDAERRERLIQHYSEMPPTRKIGEDVEAGAIVEALRDETRFGARILATNKRLFP